MEHVHTEEALVRIRDWEEAVELDATSSLKTLNLGRLPPLPVALRHLDCSEYELTECPWTRDPGLLQQPAYDPDNQLTGLSVLPVGLVALECNNNPLGQPPPPCLPVLSADDSAPSAGRSAVHGPGNPLAIISLPAPSCRAKNNSPH